MYAYTDSNDTLDKWAWLMKQTKLQLFLKVLKWDMEPLKLQQSTDACNHQGGSH